MSQTDVHDLADSMVYIVDDDHSVRASLQDLLASVAVSYTHLTLPTNREV